MWASRGLGTDYGLDPKVEIWYDIYKKELAKR